MKQNERREEVQKWNWCRSTLLVTVAVIAELIWIRETGHVRVLLFLLVGWGFGYCGHYWPIVPAPDDRWWWLWRNWWNEDWQEKPKYSEKTCPRATLSAMVGSQRLNAWAMARPTRIFRNFLLILLLPNWFCRPFRQLYIVSWKLNVIRETTLFEIGGVVCWNKIF
jgi:hypothetical protein